MADEAINGSTTGSLNGDAAVSAPAPSPDSTSAAEAAFSAREFLREQGIPVDDYKSDRDAFEAVYRVAASGPDPRLVQYARLGQEYAAYQASPEYQAYQEWLKTKGQQQAAPAPKDADEFKWEKYQRDPQWEQYLKIDPNTGAYVPRGDWVNPVLVEKANAYHQNVRQRMEQVLNEFPELVDKASSKRWKTFEGSLEGRIEEYLRRRETASRGQEYLRQNAQSLYQLDANGQIVRDPITNQPRFQPHGNLLSHYLGKTQQLALQFANAFGVDPQNIPPSVWALIENEAMDRTQSDVRVNNAWREHVSKLGQAAPPAADATAAPPAAPTPAERNEAAKNRTIATANANRRKNPPTVNGSRSVAAAAAAGPSAPRLKDLVYGKMGLE